ncbi:MAG TPA: helicase-related protein, partial [Burkholderiales bacterium]|nr:helicase-related protein [Burkholderiales bacterium]
CASVVTSDLIYKLIKNNINKSAIQLLNDMQHEEEEFIVEKAGNKSIITIATNAAGRGTDISLSQDVINKEGLHVIFTFFPSNERIEAQGAGRAGR